MKKKINKKHKKLQIFQFSQMENNFFFWKSEFRKKSEKGFFFFPHPWKKLKDFELRKKVWKRTFIFSPSCWCWLKEWTAPLKKFKLSDDIKYKEKISSGRQKLHVWSLFIARFNRREILHKVFQHCIKKKKKKKTLNKKTYNVREIVWYLQIDASLLPLIHYVHISLWFTMTVVTEGNPYAHINTLSSTGNYSAYKNNWLNYIHSTQG